MTDKLTITDESKERRRIKNIFKKRVADDQYLIKSELEYIRKMMKNDYKDQYADVLTKMLRYCNTIREEERRVRPISVPEALFKTNIIPFFQHQNLNFDGIDIAPMDENTAREYFKLFPD